MKQSRIFLVLALLVAGGALAFIATGNMGESLVYFWEPSDIQAAGEDAVGPQIRLGGLVKAGTLHWDADKQELEMVVMDAGAEVKVHATGAPPQMLREGIGVVVEGTMNSAGVFETDRLMVKHSNEYKAPEEGMAPEERKELYRGTVEGID